MLDSLPSNKRFFFYAFTFLSLLLVSPLLIMCLLPLLPKGAASIVAGLTFLPFMVWFNIGGYIIYAIQNLMGFRLVRIEEFGIVEDTHEKSQLVIAAIVTVWVLLAAFLALILTKLRQSRYRK